MARPAPLAPAPGAPARERPLRRLHRLLLRPHLAALRHPAATLVVTLALAAGFATQLPRLRVLLSLESLAERALPSTAVNQRLQRSFATGNELGVVFASAREGEALTPEQVRRIGAWVAAEERGDPDLLRAISPFGLRRVRTFGFLPGLVPIVRSGARAELADLAASPWGGVLTDRGGRDLAVELDLRDTPGGSRYGRFDPAAVGRVRERLERTMLPGSGMQVQLTGAAAFQYDSLQGIRRFRILNLAMVVLILVLLRLLLGTWRSGALLVGVLLVAAAGVAGAMALAGHPIDLLSTGLFLILAVAALEDFLYLSYLQMQGGGSWRRDFRVMLAPSFLTSLTTVIGFWSLGLSDLAIVRRLGLWAGTGAALEWVVTFVVLPAFVRRFPSWHRWTDVRRAWRSHLPGRLARVRPPRRLAVGMLAVLAAGAWGAFHLDRGDSIPHLFDAGHPLSRGFAYLKARRGYEGSVDVVLPEVDRQARNRALLARVAAAPGVAQVLSPYDVLDDALGAAHAAPSELAARNPQLRARLSSFLAADGSVRAVAYLASVDLAPLERTLAAVRRICAEGGGYVAGDLVTYAEFAERVPSTLFRSLGTCLVLVGLVLLLLLRAARQRRPLLVIGASFWGTAAMLALLWLLRVPLSFLTCIFASVLVGLTGDNVIQYLFAAPGGRLAVGIRRRGGASILVSLLMALTCLVFLGSAFVPSRRLGVLLAAGFVLSLAGDLWLLHGLLRGDGPEEETT